MIKNLFLKVFNMSITASVVIIAVLVIRYFLRKQPKIFSYILWCIVLFRLLFPWSFSTKSSLFNYLPFTNVTDNEIEYSISLPENTEIEKSNLHTIIEDDIKHPESVIKNPPPAIDFIDVLSIIWGLGVVYIILRNTISYRTILKTQNNCKLLKDNIYLNPNISTGFTIGLFSPKIYIPEGLRECENEYIILHEKQHIKRFDRVFKFLFFLAISIHWFNPIVWLSFKLFEKDMEMSCDEAVIKKLNNIEKANYCQTLLNISSNNNAKLITAFSQNETESRVKNILSYKNASFKYTILAVTIIFISALVLIMNPVENNSITLSKNDIKEFSILNVTSDINVNSLDVICDNIKNSKEVSENDILQKNLNEYSKIILKSDEVYFINEDCSYIWTEKDNQKVIYEIIESEKLKSLISNLITNYSFIQHEFNVSNSPLSSIKAFNLKISLPKDWTVSKIDAVRCIIGDKFTQLCKIYDGENKEIGILNYTNIVNAPELAPKCINEELNCSVYIDFTKDIDDNIINSIQNSIKISEILEENTDSENSLLKETNYIFPTKSNLISRGFYIDSENPSVNNEQHHFGIDIIGKNGDEIYAVRDGIVLSCAFSNHDYGNYCIIDHGDYKSLYSHCSELNVTQGQEVKKGETIAYIGNSGNSTGPHLHFEIMDDKTRYNPLNFLPYQQ